MNCSDVLELAPLYLAGDLDQARVESLTAHMQACPSCASELGQQRAFDRLFRTSLLSETVDNQRLERQIRQLLTREQESRTLRRRNFALAALAAVLALAALGVWAAFSPRARPQRVYAAAARDHRFEIVDKQPRKWVSDSASILAMAASEGVPSAVVAAIAPPGYYLAQGKFCRLDGRVFLHLVYASSLGNFSVFLRRNDAKSSEDKVIVETEGAEHVAGFEDNQLSALVVTDQSNDAALRLARSVAAVI